MLTNKLHPGRVPPNRVLAALDNRYRNTGHRVRHSSYHLRELLARREMLDRRMAVRLGEVFGTGCEFWAETQSEYETTERAQHTFNLGVTAYMFGFQPERDPRDRERVGIAVGMCHACVGHFFGERSRNG